MKVGGRAKKHFLDEHAGNTCSTGYVFTGFKCHEEPRKRKFFTVLSSVYQAWVFISCQLTQIIREYYRYNPGRGPFLESPENFSGAESRFVFVMFVCKVKVSRILRYSDTMKLSVNKEKVTGV